MYRRPQLIVRKAKLVRFNGGRRVIDLLEFNALPKEKQPEFLEDLPTFGSILKPSTSSKDDRNDDLSKLIEEITLAADTERPRPRKSVHDSEVFNKIFETIAAHGETKSNKTHQFLTNDLNRIENISLSSLKIQPAVTENQAQPNDFKESQILKLKVINALKPVFSNIKRINSNKELIQYVKSDIVAKFERSLKNENSVEHKSAKEAVESLKDMDPKKPVLNKATLPVLIEFCLKTLARDFDSSGEAISLFHSFKDSPAFYLRSCNIDVYNAVLILTWNHTKNIEDINFLTKDMILNGLPGDLKTLKILSSIKLEVMKNLANNEKDLFIDRFKKNRFYYLEPIDRRMRALMKSI